MTGSKSPTTEDALPAADQRGKDGRTRGIAHACAASTGFAAAGLFHLDAGGSRGRAVEVALDADDLGEFLGIGAARLDTELEQTIRNRRVLRCIAGLPRQQ